MSRVVDFTDENPPPPDTKAVLLFWAPWHEASVPGSSMDQVLQALADSNDGIAFGRVNAEVCPQLTEKHQVTVVPTFVLLNNGKITERVAGVENVADVTRAVQRLALQQEQEQVSETTPTQEQESLSERLDRLIRSNTVMIFIKGTPDAPRCGFSRQAVEILEQAGIAFGSFDILTDETVRQGLKQHSDWPTYPQIYVRGELMGGLDILKEMASSPESLSEQWNLTTNNKPLTLEERLKQLVHRHKVMLFMKGLPSAPRCGFSQQMVEILNAQNIEYDSFDILTDEEVRQGLKKYSDWPTYPQLYVKGELIGGLDICKEMLQDGSLKDALE